MKNLISILLVFFLLGCYIPDDSNDDTGSDDPGGLERPVYYSQSDPLWANTVMTTDTIAETGCVLTSMAMMLATQDRETVKCCV